MLCKNIENEARTVEHLYSGQALFQVTDLRAGEVVVKYDHLRVVFFESALDLVHLALADEGGRAKILHALDKIAGDDCARSFREAPEFRYLFRYKPRACLRGAYPYENAAFFFLFMFCGLFHLCGQQFPFSFRNQ